MTTDYAKALAEMENPGVYKKIPGRVVFLEHTRKTQDGKVIKVGKPELLEIARNCNQRDSRGDPCLLALGHTLKGRPEKDQPEPVGYARHFRVAWNPERKKWVITSTYYIRHKDFDYAKTFPRTSVELWGATGDDGANEDDGMFFDPISLIRRTPELDGTTWTYSADGTAEPLQYAREDGQGNAKRVLRYEMENDMADMPENTDPETTPEMGQDKMAMEYARHVLSHPHASKLMAKYAAEEPDEPPLPPTEVPGTEPPPGEDPAKYAANALPSPTNAGLPAGKKEAEEYARRQRDQQAAQYARDRQEIKALKEEFAAYKAARDAESAQYQREAEAEKYERTLIQAEGEGASFDRAKVMAYVMKLPTTELRQEYIQQVVDGPRAPIQQYGRVPTAVPPDASVGSRKVDPINDPESVPAADYEAVERYQRQCGDYQSPLPIQLARALPQKYGHLLNGANGTEKKG
ncbi:MAG: hypothetical protein KGL39_29665 [Patescibacteria group bacterium]|nr:hypothetical protein [Patescibacteria group bacterium]